MRHHYICVIWFLFFFGFCYSQHISEFNSLLSGNQDAELHLPSSHDFQVLIKTGDLLISGGSLPDNCDFSGFVPRESSSKYGYLSINSESAPGGVTILDIEYDDTIGSWQISDSKSIDFDFSILASFRIGNTAANCSGTVTPWNTIITCEEYTSDLIAKNYDVSKSFLKVDGLLGVYDGFGWAIEIDPVKKTVINQPGGRNGQDKLWAMGNFQHENAVVHENKRTVYQGADNTNGEGFLFKYVADEAEKLASGDLYVYRAGTDGNGEWIQINNKSPSEQNSTIAQSIAVNATNFLGIEDVEISPIDGKIYFAVKNESKVYRLEDSDPITGTTTSGFETYVGGQEYEISQGVSESWGRGNDNLAFDELGNLWVLQDGDRNYIWVVENGHTQSNPKVKIFGRTPAGSEPTGITFSPDYKFLFMSIMHPSATNNSSVQTDATGHPAPFDDDTVIVIARKEYLGQNQTDSQQDILFTQYYQDDVSQSNWLEIKNISGKKIFNGNYYLHLYDDTKLGNINNELPKATFQIPEMEAGEVILLKNKESPDFPRLANLGNAYQFQSDVCEYDGNDVILITSSPGLYRYKNRHDILGKLDGSSWGQNTSIIRGANRAERADREFNQSNWMELDAYTEVNLANPNTNISLGTHGSGATYWDGKDWNNFFPDRTRDVVVSDVLNGAIQDLEAYNLEIENGGHLNFEDPLESNQSVIVHHNLIVKGEFTLGDTESLIMLNENALIEGEITKIENSSVRNHIYDFTYWSSPVFGNTIASTFPGVNKDRIFYFDQSVSSAINRDDPDFYNTWIKADQSDKMIKGLGYAAEGIDDGVHEVQFLGVPNNGDVLVPLKGNFDDGEPLNDFNLIGNPYPSGIDIETFLDKNLGVIDGTIYLWTHNSTADVQGEFNPSDYAMYNKTGGTQASTGGAKPNRYFGSAQGFFVRALKSDPVLFNNAMRIKGINDQFFKNQISKNREADKDRIWLNLTTAEGGFHQLLIGFIEGATEGIDLAYDGLNRSSESGVDFFSHINDQKFTIQGLPPFSDEFTVYLGVEIKGLPRSFNISIDQLEGKLLNAEIYLEDRELKIIHDLKNSDYYLDMMAPGVYDNRYILHFRKATILNVEDFNPSREIIISQTENQLKIDAADMVKSVKIYDVLGRVLHTEKPYQDSFTIETQSLKRGSVVFVSLELNNGLVKTIKTILF